ncbi:MAG: hypothetical protein AAF683_00300 [Pseudomonadota bacterium]
MSAEAAVVHRLMVSSEALEIMAEAIKVLTLQKGSFQRLKDVITEALDTIDPSNTEMPFTFEQAVPLDGGIPIHLRLSKDRNDRLDVFRNKLCGRIGDHCGVRETVIFCAMKIAKE